MADPVASAVPSDRLNGLSAHDPAAHVVTDVVRQVLAAMRGNLSAAEANLLSEVQELGRTIAAAKAEIAALQVDEITASHIPSATDELDAIIAHTAAATDSILEVCETLDRLAGGLAAKADATPAPEVAARLQEATTRIYEACSFQDITGQRITKVVATLKTIEAKVASIIATFGAGDARAAAPGSQPGVLLSGPQLPAAAMDQTDIDKLLASFE